MALDPVTGAFELGKDLLDRFIPDAKQKAEAAQKLLEMKQSGELAQMAADKELMLAQADINKVEAASPNLFIAGWRPFIGWVLGAGLTVMLVVGPLMAWSSALAGRPIEQPKMPEAIIMSLSTCLLGLSGMRSWEKYKNVEGNR